MLIQPLEPPRFIEPMLPTLAPAPPAGEGWIHEIKYDGYRGQIRLHGGKASVLTRNGYDWTDRLAELPQAAQRLPAMSAVLDGELVFMRPDGKTCFDSLQDGLRFGGNGLRFGATGTRERLPLRQKKVVLFVTDSRGVQVA